LGDVVLLEEPVLVVTSNDKGRAAPVTSLEGIPVARLGDEWKEQLCSK
jgi:uncharacterized Zn-binding protein involved in type VI secretion